MSCYFFGYGNRRFGSPLAFLFRPRSSFTPPALSAAERSRQTVLTRVTEGYIITAITTTLLPLNRPPPRTHRHALAIHTLSSLSSLGLSTTCPSAQPSTSTTEKIPSQSASDTDGECTAVESDDGVNAVQYNRPSFHRIAIYPSTN
ncbi:hypothetical protein FRB95_013584 [Tulasnella sp. JGI-2019a]|nr:hypothetical protein FRB95_013584 [Tulasnella sp. JGI-2019a]